MQTKSISIIIPVKPGGSVAALDALRDVDYPAEAVEVIVAEGKCPSRQRNSAAAVAAGDILCFLDDDSLVGLLHLQKTARHYADTAVAAVGGPSLTPDTDTPLQQSFGLVLASLFGGGGVRNRYRRSGGVRQTDDSELILCNLSIRRDLFRDFGGFDERLYPNEENELLVRIAKSGQKLVHDPELAVRRSQRRTYKAFVRQLFGYGRGRGRQTLISGISGCASFIPAAFLLYLCTLPLVDKPVYYLPLLCYLVIDLVSSTVVSARAGKPRLAPLLGFLFPTLHLAYGAGILWEFAAYRFGKRGPADGEVTLRRVKEFGFNRDNQDIQDDGLKNN